MADTASLEWVAAPTLAAEYSATMSKATRGYHTGRGARRGSGFTGRYTDTGAHYCREHSAQRRVTPIQLLMRDRGDCNDGDYGLAVVTGAIYHSRCQDATLPRPTRENIPSYHSIRQYRTQHLQQRTLMCENPIRMEELWLQELQMIRPLMDSNHIGPKTTGLPHMVIHTNPSKVRLAVFRNR
jgi:hypothetical protein